MPLSISVEPIFFGKKIAQLDNCIYFCNQMTARMALRRDVFQAIADPSRRAILAMVAVNAMTPGAIAASFSSSRQTISKHIQILAECDLLHQRQQGREIYYHFNPDKLKEIAHFIEPFHAFWDDRFHTLESLMKEQFPHQ